MMVVAVDLQNAGMDESREEYRREKREDRQPEQEKQADRERDEGGAEDEQGKALASCWPSRRPGQPILNEGARQGLFPVLRFHRLAVAPKHCPEGYVPRLTSTSVSFLGGGPGRFFQWTSAVRSGFSQGLSGAGLPRVW